VSTVAEETTVGIAGRCGYCIGLKPGDEAPVPVVKKVTVCPCCGQLATALYEGACTASHASRGSR
jgi:hypothetical protein